MGVPLNQVDTPGPARASDQGKPRVLILGLGNDILTDDSIGLRVARIVKENLLHRLDVQVVDTSESGLSLLDLIVGFDRLIVVDAVQTGQAQAGFVHRIQGEDLTRLTTVSPHFVGFGEMLQFGRRLGLCVPAVVVIFAIEVKDPHTVSTTLTPQLERELPRIVALVEAEV